jgi:ketosteroid isomerase-like protein
VTTRELVESGYAAISRGDLEGFLELVDPEVEFNSLVAEAEGKTYRGHAGVREWWESVRSALGGLDLQVQEIRDLGKAEALVRIRVIGTLSGVAIPQTMWQATRARAGKVVSWNVFRTEAEAIQAVEARR